MVAKCPESSPHQSIVLVAKCVPKDFSSAMAIYTAPHIVQRLSCRCGNSPFVMSCLGLNHLTICKQAIVEGPMWRDPLCCSSLVLTHMLHGPNTATRAGSECFMTILFRGLTWTIQKLIFTSLHLVVSWFLLVSASLLVVLCACQYHALLVQWLVSTYIVQVMVIKL